MFARVAVLAASVAFAAAALAGAGPHRPPPKPKSREQPIWAPAPESRSQHFRIQSDLGIETTRIYAEHLDTMHEGYSRRFASLPPRVPEVPLVLMFATERDYRDVMRIRYGIDATGSRGMFFVAPTGAALAFSPESLPRSCVLRLIQHEGFHQYAHSRFLNALPPWLGEGLAEYFGQAVVIQGRIVDGQSTPASVEAVKLALDAGRTVPFARMLAMTADAWNENVRSGDGGLQYLQAWSMVQFLCWAENGRHRESFDRYIAAIHSGIPSVRAFTEAFRTNDPDQFERAWRAWAAEQKASPFGTAAERLTFLAEGMKSLSAEGVAVEGFDDLISKLRERDFSTEVTIHGRSARMRADASILEIPRAGLADASPVFELLPSRKPPTTRTEKEREGTTPLPPEVTTRGLAPRELVLRWKRLKSGGVDYFLESPKDAPRPRDRGKDPE